MDRQSKSKQSYTLHALNYLYTYPHSDHLNSADLQCIYLRNTLWQKVR